MVAPMDAQPQKSCNSLMPEATTKNGLEQLIVVTPPAVLVPSIATAKFVAPSPQVNEIAGLSSVGHSPIGPVVIHAFSDKSNVIG